LHHWHSLMLLNIYEGQTADAGIARWWVVWFRSGDSNVKRQSMLWMDMHSCMYVHYKMKSASTRSSKQMGRLWTWSWISASVHWKWWWQRWHIAKFAAGESHKCSHRNRRNTVCKFVRTFWTNMRLKVTVFSTPSLLVIRCGVTSMSYSQNGSPQSGDVNSPSKKKFKTQPSAGIVLCLVIWDRKGDPSGLPGTWTKHLLWLLHHNID